MANCIHNHVESMAKRYLKATPEPQPDKINYHLLWRIIQHLVSEVKQHYKPEFSFHKYVSTKPGGSRRRFLKAYNQLLNGDGDIMRASKISAFIKNERYFEEGKAPRMIMGRDPRFNIHYARFIARFEDAFYQLPQMANTCDFWQCGEKFAKIYSRTRRIGENDMSKYESSQRWLYMAIEFLVYALTCPEDEVQNLTTLFAVKMVKAGHTSEGLKFYFEHCRGSGDLDTGCGNGVGNYVCTMYLKIMNFCPHGPECCMNNVCCDFDGFVAKGDDSYFGIPENHTGPLVDTYAHFGLDAKLIVRDDGLQTEFCSGHFVRLSNGRFLYVQKLRKLINSVSTLINPDTIKNGWASHYYRSLGDMYSVLYGELPVYGELAKFLQTANEKLRININLVQESYGANQAYSLKPRSVQRIDVCPETMLDMASANDFTFAELESLKRFFSTTRLEFPPHMRKRCNLRNRADARFELMEDIQHKFDVNIKDKTVKGFKRQLKQLLRNPLQGLSQAFAQS